MARSNRTMITRDRGGVQQLPAGRAPWAGQACKRLRPPRLCEHRPPVSRGRRGSALTRSATESGWFEVVIEQIEMDAILRPSLVAPQFAGRETNRIDVLRLLAKEMGVRIREQEDAVIAFDGSRS
jgi:hypothetical protein